MEFPRYRVGNETQYTGMKYRFYTSTSRKIYANAYLDDRAGLRQVYDELSYLVKYETNRKGHQNEFPDDRPLTHQNKSQYNDPTRILQKV